MFSQRRDMGPNPKGAFARDQNDPVTRALKVVGAERAAHGDIYMCTWDEAADALDAVFPFAGDKNHCHFFALPARRAAHGPNIHSWAFGARLGPKAAGTWSNRVEGARQIPPALRKVNYRGLLMTSEAPN